MTDPHDDGALDTARCYRHPHRETLVSCGSCGRPICTECMVETPVGMRCAECAHGPAPSLDQRVRQARNRVRGAGHQLTIAIIVVNVAMFLVEYMRAGSGPINTKLLFDMGAVFGPAIADGEPWRLVTGGFLHAGTAHIVLNMLALWMVGSILEDGIGQVPMGFIYLASVLWGSAGAVLLNPNTVTVGASGGVFGLMGALLVVAHQRNVRELRGSLFVVLALNLAFTLAIPGISIGGHIGGLLGGVVACLLVSRRGHVAARPAAGTALAMVVMLAAATAAGMYLSSHPRGGTTASVAPPGGVASVVMPGTSPLGGPRG